MSELKEKKFGYVVQPPHHPPAPPPPFPAPIPPGMTMQDWMQYINSYIDVRAKQLYEKLKDLYTGGGIDIDTIGRVVDEKLSTYVFDKVAIKGDDNKVHDVDVDVDGFVKSTERT